MAIGVELSEVGAVFQLRKKGRKIEGGEPSRESNYGRLLACTPFKRPKNSNQVGLSETPTGTRVYTYAEPGRRGGKMITT